MDYGGDGCFGTVRAFGADDKTERWTCGGAPVLEPIEHSVLEKPLDGEPMEGVPVLEPIEHSVLEKPLDGGPMKEMSVLEPLEHSVLLMARTDGPIGGGASSGTDRAFGSGKAPGRWTVGEDVDFGTVAEFGSGCCPSVGRLFAVRNDCVRPVGAFRLKCSRGR